MAAELIFAYFAFAIIIFLGIALYLAERRMGLYALFFVLLAFMGMAALSFVVAGNSVGAAGIGMSVVMGELFMFLMAGAIAIILYLKWGAPIIKLVFDMFEIAKIRSILARRKKDASTESGA